MGRTDPGPPAGTRELTLGTDQIPSRIGLIHEVRRLRCGAMRSCHFNGRTVSSATQSHNLHSRSLGRVLGWLCPQLCLPHNHPSPGQSCLRRPCARRRRYTFSITPRGSSEVAELGEAFSKMRGELFIPTAMDRNRADRRFGRAGAQSLTIFATTWRRFVANAESCTKRRT